jgi:hypothetical protein
MNLDPDGILKKNEMWRVGINLHGAFTAEVFIMCLDNVVNVRRG